MPDVGSPSTRVWELRPALGHSTHVHRRASAEGRKPSLFSPLFLFSLAFCDHSCPTLPLLSFSHCLRPLLSYSSSSLSFLLLTSLVFLCSNHVRCLFFLIFDSPFELYPYLNLYCIRFPAGFGCRDNKMQLLSK